MVSNKFIEFGDTYNIHGPFIILEEETAYEWREQNVEIVVKARVMWNMLGPTMERSSGFDRNWNVSAFGSNLWYVL